MATCSINGLNDLLGQVGLDVPVPEFPGGYIVHNPQDIFRAYLADTLQKLVNCDRVVAYEAIQPSNISGMGDLVIVSPKLRLRDVKPKDLVADLAHKLPRSPPFACPLADGINLRVFSSPNTLPRLLLPYIHDRNTTYGFDRSLGLVDPSLDTGPRKKVIVEFSSPNMGNDFQVKHLRSTIAGAYVSNIHEGMGWDVVRMNYLGDWGKQIGLLAAGWQRFGSDDAFAQDPLKHLLDVNHQINELFKPEGDERAAAKGQGKDTAEIESRGLYAERDAMFKKMEDNDEDVIALWKRFRDATVKHYPDIYARLGVHFDEYSGESQVTAESIAEVEAALKEHGICEEHEGAWRIDFANHGSKGLSVVNLRYRNGTSTYFLRDIAAVLDRFKAHSFDKLIYVFAIEQEMHFNRVKRTLELIGRSELASKIQHVQLAKITGLLEPFSESRLLGEYLDGSREAARLELAEEDEDAQSFVNNTDESLECLGLSALSIQDLSHKRTTSYGFQEKRMLSLSHESGVAIQNCYARLLGVLKDKGGEIDYASLNFSKLEMENYTEALRVMAQYPDTVAASFKNLEPSTIILYLHRLVYQLMVTLDEDEEVDWSDKDEEVRARMGLYESAKQVMDNALKVLGVIPWNQ